MTNRIAAEHVQANFSSRTQGLQPSAAVFIAVEWAMNASTIIVERRKRQISYQVMPGGAL
jgi:hypothetical protein